jgi:predicted membrane protein
MSYEWYDFVGNMGVTLILGSYRVLHIHKVDSKSVAYSVSNAIGAVLILVSLCFAFNLSSFIIEIFWLLISLYGLLHTKKSNNSQQPRSKKEIAE